MKRIALFILHRVILRNTLRFIVGIQYRKQEVLKSVDQFVIVANHNSHLDTLAMLASLPSNKLHITRPVAAKDYFGKTRFTELLSNFFLNTLLIERKISRDSAQLNPVEQMVDALDRGFSLIIFPEGTRGQPEEFQAFKKGIGKVLIEKPHIPYVPVYTFGLGKSMPKGDELIIPFNSTILFGNPKIVQSDKPQDIVKEIESDILKLKKELGN